MRIILYTGKGGVGKTSVAAASACQIAATGKKVLIMSTDQAHSLGDSFDVTLGREPKQVADHLFAMEIDTVYESEKSWGKLKDYIKRLLTIRGGESIEVEELLVFPGLEELFSMFRILDVFEQGEYDVLIVDCAPTGETLSLLKYPERLSDILEKVLPMKRKVVKIAGPAVEKLTKMPMPADHVFDDVEYLVDKMGRLQKLMMDKNTVSLRIVTTPEKIVIAEAKRNFTCLYLYNYNVDAIIVNRIYPQKALEGYFSKWITRQEDALRDIEESFSEIPRFYLKLQKGELRTVKVLSEASEELFRGIDPSEILFQEQVYHMEKTEDGGLIKIFLPFASKGELDLQQEGKEIILSIKNETRRFTLPAQLCNLDISSAKFADGYLNIIF